MKRRRFLALASSALCLAVVLSAGWLWQTLAAPKFEARARLVAGIDPVADPNAEADKTVPIDEARILSPEVLSAAALLIADRNVPLSLASPFDSVTDYLLERIHVGRADRGAPDEILITCSAKTADESLQMLSAVVDAYLDAATTAQPARNGSGADESPTIELQTECDQLARAIEQKQQAIAELTAQQEAAKTIAGGSAGNDPISLEAELVQARRASGDAADRLAAARLDFEKKLPGEFIAARIADVPARTKVLARLNRAKIKNDLDQQEALRQKWSAVYGRNHPRMAEIRQHIESLEQQVGRFSAPEATGEKTGETGQPADALPASEASIVLAALEAESAGFKTNEQQLEARLAGSQQRLQQQQELETRLNDSRQELEFLHGEHSRLWKQIDSARRTQTNELATLIEPPALSSNAVAPQAGLPMATTCASSMTLCLLVIWQFRNRAPEIAIPDAAPAKEEPPIRRERFRSHEEEQLMRLKLQSARSSRPTPVGASEC